MIHINRSIDLTIYIIFHFSFVMIFFNSENISVSITLYEKLLFFFIFVDIYSNIASFQPLNRIRLSLMGAYSRGGGLFKSLILDIGAYSNRHIVLHAIII